jgi:hypothetical protein
MCEEGGLDDVGVCMGSVGGDGIGVGLSSRLGSNERPRNGSTTTYISIIS